MRSAMIGAGKLVVRAAKSLRNRLIGLGQTAIVRGRENLRRFYCATALRYLSFSPVRRAIAADLSIGRHRTDRYRRLAADPDFAFMCIALAWNQRAAAQLLQDLWVLHETDFRSNGFFVDVGASDGIGWSNTLLLERAFGWRGILIEPNPIHRETLPRNRRSKVHFGCIGPRTGDVVDFWSAAEHELSGIGAYANQDDHAATRQAHVSRTMTTISLNDALRECDAPREIDYVSLDTEGSELDILSTFDFAGYRVRLWTIEHNHTANEAKIDRLMASHGYVRKFPDWSHFDAWYVRPG
jgi:FkbM family methyltransferase